MAIDTAAKRHSALMDTWGMIPVPDGSFDASDRLTLLGFYSGIAVAVVLDPIPPMPAVSGRSVAPTFSGRSVVPSVRGRVR